MTGTTPSRFERLIRDVSQYVRDDLLGNAWEEWTEERSLLPDERDGAVYPEAVHKEFGTAGK